MIDLIRRGFLFATAIAVSSQVNIVNAQVEFEQHLIVENLDQAMAIYAADMDDDGDMDFVSAARGGDDISWWGNDGNESFERHIVDNNFDGAEDAVIVDLDNDGDMDIIGAAISGDMVSWWENDGEHNFESHIIAGDFGSASAVSAADLNNDGNIDVLGGGEPGVYWWENDGNQRFEDHALPGNVGRVYDIYTCDVDGDDDIDVVAALYASAGICWWENDGDGGFTVHHVDNFGGALGIHADDLDEDGDIDFIVTGYGSNTVGWWENDGDQEFERHIIDEDLDDPWDIFTGDMDNDGDSDLICSVYGSDSIFLWENDGDANFDQHHSITDQYQGPTGLFIVDLDGDSDDDIIATAFQGDQITWWENLSPNFQMIVEPDTIDFGPVAVETDRMMNMEIIYQPEAEDLGDLNVEIQIRQDGDWLWVEPQEAVIPPEESIDVEVSVFIAEDEEMGQHEALIIIIPNELENRAIEVPVSIFAVEGFGTLRGIVVDASNDSPVPDIIVDLDDTPLQEVTDNQGRYSFDDLPAWTYSVVVEVDDFLPYRSAEFHVGARQDVVLDIELLHALCQSDCDTVEVELLPDRVAEVDISLSNPGNGDLEFSAERRFQFAGDADPWERRFGINAAEITGDDRLQGVEFDGENFYIDGGSNGEGRGMVYVFSDDGEHVRSFDQFNDSHWGMRDLAWDGELLWGGDDEVIYGFTTEGELVHQFEGPLEINRAMTWDNERELLWVCDVTTDMFGMDREGNVVTQIDLPENIHIYGLGTFPEDSVGYTIYAFCKDGDFETRIIKINPVSGDIVIVADIESVEELKAGGMSITSTWDPMSWVCVGVLQGRQEVPDEIGVWQVGTRHIWLNSEPEEGVIHPGASVQVNISLDSEGFSPDIELNAELYITHNGRGEPITIPIIMRVVREEGISQPAENGIIPGEYSLGEPYPNPFNNEVTIAYNIPQPTRVSIQIHDLAGRQIMELVNKYHEAGSFSTVWDGDTATSGLYIVTMKSSGFQAVRKVILVR